MGIGLFRERILMLRKNYPCFLLL